MMTEHPYSADSQKPDGEASIFKRILMIIVNHWQWKLLCLVLAIFLWGLAVSQNTTLTREKVIRDVRISTLNAATLQRNGLIVVSGLEDLENVTIKAEVPLENYSKASASNYNVRIDLSSITAPGAQTVPLTAVASTSYGTVTDISRPSVDVVVENYLTRSTIPVRVNKIGNTPEGYYANKTIAEIESVTVAGPASIVSQIVRCEVQYTVPEVIEHADTYPTASPFWFVDISGNILDDSLLTVTRDGWGIDSIVVQQTFYPQVELAISDIGLLTGSVPEGYEVKSVQYSPNVITVADMDISAHTDDFLYLKNSVDLTDKTGSFTQIVPISRPSGIVYVSTDVVYVTVEIAPVTNAEADDT